MGDGRNEINVAHGKLYLERTYRKQRQLQK